MKLILVLSILFSINIFGAANKVELVTQLAKEIETSFINKGSRNVESSFSMMNVEDLDEDYAKEISISNQSKLNESQFKDLYNCLGSNKCDVYKIIITSSYYSGYNINAVYLSVKDNLSVKRYAIHVYGE